MPYFERPGFSFHYEVVEGALPADTVFLHGNLASNLWWEPAREILRTKGEPHWKGRMVLAEWRGFGGSVNFNGALDLPTLAEDVNALVRSLELEAPRLVGHSTGGVIALAALASAPSLYERALLLDSVTPEGVPFGPEALAAFAEMGRNRDTCAAILLSTIHGGNLSEAFRERIVDAAFNAHPAVWQGVPEMLRPPLPRINLEAVRCPVLVAHGEHDNVLTVAGARSLAQALPRGELKVLPGRGHCPNVEDPELFVQLALGFLHRS